MSKKSKGSAPARTAQGRNASGRRAKSLPVYMSTLCPVIMICALLMQGCSVPDRTIDNIPELSQEEWADYYQRALDAYNNPDTWKACGKERPLEFSLHATKSMEPWGRGLHGKDRFDLVIIHVPVMNIGEEGQGVPHVNVYFQHPEKVITNITTSRIVL